MDATPLTIQPLDDQPPKPKRGRPKGSKNKPKPPGHVSQMKPNDGRRRHWVKVTESGMPVASQPRAKAAGVSGRGKAKTAKRKAPSARGVAGATASKKTRLGPKMAAVYATLEALGVEDASSVSNCLKQGILNGFVELKKPEDDPDGEFGLDQVLLEGQCMFCDGHLKCRIRDILYQPDYGGNDYEDGAECAPFKCYSKGEDADGSEEEGEEEDREVCHGWYVTGICRKDATFDCGKFHNHCTECRQFGQCIGDYREQHCPRCKGHFFACDGHFKCSRCNPGALDDSDDDL